MEAPLSAVEPPLPGRPAITPSEALNRFEPPEGFAPVATEAPVKRIRYGFRAAGLSFLIRENVTSEVVPTMPFALIPNGPAWLLGMINLHGNLVPVCDIKRLLGAGDGDESGKPMILVIDKGENAAGFIIDGFPRAITGLRPSAPVPGLPDLLAKNVLATLATDSEVWLEFDNEGFLLEANRQ